MNNNRLMQNYKKQNKYIRELTDTIIESFANIDTKVDDIKKDTDEIKDNTKKTEIIDGG